MNIAAEFSLYRIDVYVKNKKHLRPVPDWYCDLEIRINSAFTLEIRIIITERLYFSSSDFFFSCLDTPQGSCSFVLMSLVLMIYSEEYQFTAPKNNHLFSILVSCTFIP